MDNKLEDRRVRSAAQFRLDEYCEKYFGSRDQKYSDYRFTTKLDGINIYVWQVDLSHP